MEEIVRKAIDLDKRSIGRLISYFEDNRPGSSEVHETILGLLDEYAPENSSFIFGFTGTPGSGKSTLIGKIANSIIEGNADKSVAVIAVDPSSKISGGAFLGDRTRVSFPLDEKRLFFRSQAADMELGGVSRHTYSVCRLLSRLFDYIFIETVGIGQSEIEVQYLSDRIYLILQPMTGDQVQFMKAGIMEVPDVFILNKYDQTELAEKSYHALRASLSLARPAEEEEPHIIKASALTGLGLDEIIDDILSMDKQLSRHDGFDKEEYFFEKWVRDEYGRTGLNFLLHDLGGSGSFIRMCGAFDKAQEDFGKGYPEWIKSR